MQDNQEKKYEELNEDTIDNTNPSINDGDSNVNI